MSDRATLALAVVALVAARLAPPVPLWVGVALLGLAALCTVAVVRPAGHPAPGPLVVLLVVALGVLVAGRAATELARLAKPVPAEVDGIGLVRSDPEPRPGGVSVHLEVDGRRYLAALPAAVVPGASAATVGDRWRVRGRTAPLRGVPVGWVRSRHLAGRLRVDRAAPGPPPDVWDRIAGTVRLAVVRGAAGLPEGDRALYLGLVVGDDRGQEPLLRHQFRAAGLAHLLAVSGQNVAFALAAAAPFRRRVHRRARLPVALGVLALFTAVARPEASVLRAVAMAAVVLVAAALGRPVTGRRAIGLAVTVLLVADPLLVHSTGFRLSLAATSGLVLLARPIADRLPGPGPLAVAAGAALAAEVATAPFVLALAGGLPVLAPLANVVAVPAAGAVMVLGLTVGPLAGVLPPPLARVVQWPTALLVRWTARVAATAAAAPLPLLGPARLAVLLLLGSAGVVLARAAPGRRVVVVVGAAAVVTAALLVVVVPPALGPGRHRISPAVDLAVGRCGGRVLLVDGTPSRPDRVLDELRRRGVARVDVVVAGPGRATVALARDVAAVVRVGRTVVVGDAAPVGTEPLGSGTVEVGGVAVSARPLSGRAGLSAVRCTVGP